MIVRILAVDPTPAAGRSDILVYQVPENSREFAVLTAALTASGVEWEEVKSVRKNKVTLTKVVCTHPDCGCPPDNLKCRAAD